MNGMITKPQRRYMESLKKRQSVGPWVRAACLPGGPGPWHRGPSALPLARLQGTSHIGDLWI